MLLPFLRSYSSPPSLEDRIEPPTVFAVRLMSIVTYLSGFVKFMFSLLTNGSRRDIIKIIKEAHCCKRFTSKKEQLRN